MVSYTLERSRLKAERPWLGRPPRDHTNSAMFLGYVNTLFPASYRRCARPPSRRGVTSETTIGLFGALDTRCPTDAPRVKAVIMSDKFEFFQRTLIIGIGATIVMDLWALSLRQLGIPSLNFALLGRWIGHLRAGRWFHVSIAAANPVRGERLFGWCAHYSIGVTFAGVLLAIAGLDWARSPSLLPAVSVGVLTVVAPLFVLQPALGAGVASTKTPAPLFNCGKSLVTHTVYGFGLYFAALAAAWLLPRAA